MLNVDVVDALLQLEKVMVAGNYANRSIIAYARELFKVPKHPKKLKIPTSIINLCRVGSSQVDCPKCKKGKLALTSVVLARSRDGPSKAFFNQGFGLQA